MSYLTETDSEDTRSAKYLILQITKNEFDQEIVNRFAGASHRSATNKFPQYADLSLSLSGLLYSHSKVQL